MTRSINPETLAGVCWLTAHDDTIATTQRARSLCSGMANVLLLRPEVMDLMEEPDDQPMLLHMLSVRAVEELGEDAPITKLLTVVFCGAMTFLDPEDLKRGGVYNEAVQAAQMAVDRAWQFIESLQALGGDEALQLVEDVGIEGAIKQLVGPDSGPGKTIEQLYKLRRAGRL